MKKNKTFNFLKLGILLFGVSLLLWNCEKETSLLNNIENQQKLIPNFKIISKEILNKDANINSKLKIFETNKKNKLKSSKESGDYIYLQKFDFFINTKFSIINTIQNFKTYTFEVERENKLENTLENLIIHFDTISKVSKQFLLKYPIIGIDSYDFENIQIEEINDSSLIKILAKGGEDCIDVLEYTSSQVDYPCLSGNHSGTSQANDCDYGGTLNGPFSISSGSWGMIAYCSDVDELIFGDSGGAIDAGQTGGGSSSSGSGIISIPLNIFTIQLTSFLNSLTPAQSQYLSDNINVHNNVTDFFEDNSFNTQNTNFAAQAVDALLNNDKVNWYDKIINKLEDKALCVYDKLTESSIEFKDAIQKFDGDFPVSHLNLIMEDLGNIRGETRAPDGAGTSPDYVITIAINNNSNIHGAAYRPNLMTAKTIAHEVIHAEMFRKLLSVLDNGGNIAGVTRQNVLDALDGDFPGMYDYYRRHKNWQHQQMATHYRETIAGVLKDFDNNQHSNQFYMDLAWEGLIYEKGSKAIYTWTSQNQQEKDRVKKAIKDYIKANKNETCQ